VAMLGADIGVALTSSLFVETVFGLPGVGRLLVTAGTGRDLPMTFGIVTVAATVVILLGFVVDALYVVLDPRLRLGAARR